MPIPQHAADRRVTRASARDALSRSEVSDATDAELNRALAAIDQDAVYDEERPTWTVEVWDRQSPVNDVAASHFLERGDVPDSGDVYLVKQGERVVVFQPHDPETQGIAAIPAGTGLDRGGRHADVIAAGRTAARVVGMIADHIRAARAPA